MAVKKAGRSTPKPPEPEVEVKEPGPVARAIQAPAHARGGVPPRNPPPVPKPSPIKVRALSLGYYDHVRRREGDVFVIADEKAFSSRWMERVDPRTPERVTTAKEALQRKHDEILGGTVTGAKDVLADE